MAKAVSFSPAGSGRWPLRFSLSSAKAGLVVAVVCLALALPRAPAQASEIEPLCNGRGAELDHLHSGRQCAAATPNSPAAESRSQSVTIVQFRFAGNTLFTSKTLAAVLAEDLNRPLSFGNLHALSDKVERFYRAHGRLAIVVLPAQDISANKLTFVVVEAKPGKLHMEARWELDAAANRLS